MSTNTRNLVLFGAFLTSLGLTAGCGYDRYRPASYRYARASTGNQRRQAGGVLEAMGLYQRGMMADSVARLEVGDMQWPDDPPTVSPPMIPQGRNVPLAPIRPAWPAFPPPSQPVVSDDLLRNWPWLWPPDAGS